MPDGFEHLHGMKRQPRTIYHPPVPFSDGIPPSAKATMEVAEAWVNLCIRFLAWG